MTQIWPGFGDAPVPTVVSIICKPEGVVMVFPAVCADAPGGVARRKAPAMAMAMAIGRFGNRKRRIFKASFTTEGEVVCAEGCSISERAAVLARIGPA